MEDALCERDAIQRLRDGEVAALEALVRRHQVQAIRAAYLVTYDRGLAEDVVQSAFVRAYERIHQLDPERPFAPWFLKSVLRDAIKAATRSARSVPLASAEGSTLPGSADATSDPSARWERLETAMEVWHALARLTPEQRAAVVQRYYLGWSEAQMAEAIQRPVSTVKWRLHAARERLRLLLGPALRWKTDEP